MFNLVINLKTVAGGLTVGTLPFLAKTGSRPARTSIGQDVRPRTQDGQPSSRLTRSGAAAPARAILKELGTSRTQVT